MIKINWRYNALSSLISAAAEVNAPGALKKLETGNLMRAIDCADKIKDRVRGTLLKELAGRVARFINEISIGEDFRVTVEESEINGFTLKIQSQLSAVLSDETTRGVLPPLHAHAEKAVVMAKSAFPGIHINFDRQLGHLYITQTIDLM